jgi:hypothetical protein
MHIMLTWIYPLASYNRIKKKMLIKYVDILVDSISIIGIKYHLELFISWKNYWSNLPKSIIIVGRVLFAGNETPENDVISKFIYTLWEEIFSDRIVVVSTRINNYLFEPWRRFTRRILFLTLQNRSFPSSFYRNFLH